MAIARISFSKDVVPLVAMITVEITNVGLNTIFKAATLQGMSYHAFVFYSYAVASLVLLPLALFSPRITPLPPFSFNIFSRICMLAMIGVLAQIMAYAGVDYSSPTMASAIGNLSPAFTFILAVLCRMERVDLRSSITRAKIIGTLVSISGAFFVVFYEGPTLIPSKSSSIQLYQPIKSSSSIDQNWILGGLLLAAEWFMLSVWYIVQTQIMKLYPAELLVVLLYNVCCMFMSLPLCLLGETNMGAWRIGLDIGLAAIVYSGVFGSTFSTVVHTWGLRIKGPVYISIFKPLSIVIAAFMTVLFLGYKLCLGSVIGAIIISFGFYAVMWGKAKEEKAENGMESLSDQKTPLLKDSAAVLSRIENTTSPQRFR